MNTVYIKDVEGSTRKEQWDELEFSKNNLKSIPGTITFLIKGYGSDTFKKVPRTIWLLFEAISELSTYEQVDSSLLKYSNAAADECTAIKRELSSTLDGFFNKTVKTQTDYDTPLAELSSLADRNESQLTTLTYLDTAINTMEIGDNLDKITLAVAIKSLLAYSYQLNSVLEVNVHIIVRLRNKADHTEKLGIFEYQKLTKLKNQVEKKADTVARILDDSMRKFDTQFPKSTYAKDEAPASH